MDNSLQPDAEQPAVLAPPPSTPPRSHKKVMIVALAVVVVAVGVLFVVTRNKSSVQLPPASVQTVVPDAAEVTITPSGFSPATIQISKNQSVTWVNQDDALRQIAADPHPSHGSLPGLVSAPLNKGDTYTFPFETAGTYTYHDELDPLKVGGTIIVK